MLPSLAGPRTSWVPRLLDAYRWRRCDSLKLRKSVAVQLRLTNQKAWILKIIDVDTQNIATPVPIGQGFAWTTKQWRRETPDHAHNQSLIPQSRSL